VSQPAVAADDGANVIPSGFERPVPGKTSKVKPRTVMKGARTPSAPPDATWPEAATTLVDLGMGTATSGAKSVRVPSLPLTLETDVAESRPARGGVETRVLGREATKKAGVDGLLFTLRSKDAKAKAQPGRIRSTLDYSGFAGAYGGG